MNVLLLYFAKQSEENAHDGTDDVEEAEGEIDEGGDAEHCGLCHAACRPRHEDRSDGRGVFGGTAEEFGLVPSVSIFFLIDGCVHDDGEELIAHDEIEQYARQDCGGDEREGVGDGFEQNASETAEHIACHHA